MTAKGLTVKEAAERLGFKEMTVYRYVQLGRIKPRRYGRALRIFQEDNDSLFRARDELKRVDQVDAE